MKTFIIFLLTMLQWSATVAAQALRPAVLATAGQSGVSANSQARLAFTLGEVAIATLSQPGVSCGQGFHNGAKLPTTGTFAPEAWDIRLYPNPVAQTLYVEYEAPAAAEHYIVSVRNLLGQPVVEPFRIDRSGTQAIPVWHLADGVYLLSLTGHDGQEAVFRFVKIR